MTSATNDMDGERLITFAAVGISATLFYLLVALTANTLGLGAVVSSLLAYTLSALLSYTGHRLLTFRSSASIRETAPRFAYLSIVQYVIALAIPLILTNFAGLPPLASFIAVCVIVPASSLLAMSRFVFRAAACPSASGSGERTNV
jgi:putative flippase GtrA